MNNAIWIAPFKPSQRDVLSITRLGFTLVQQVVDADALWTTKPRSLARLIMDSDADAVFGVVSAAVVEAVLTTPVNYGKECRLFRPSFEKHPPHAIRKWHFSGTLTINRSPDFESGEAI